MSDSHVPRVEPHSAFADRLERDLLRRLAGATTAVEFGSERVARESIAANELVQRDLDLVETSRPRRPGRAFALALAVAIAVVAVVGVASRPDRERVHLAPVAGQASNGLIAFTGVAPRDDTRDDDIHVVGPDGNGLRTLATAAEAPAWSPDGRRLAFVRLVDGHFAVVAVDPATGTATFSADLRMVVPEDPLRLAWSPDGRRIVVGSANTNKNTLIVDVETQAISTFDPPVTRARVSPDGTWLAALACLVGGPDPCTNELVLIPVAEIRSGNIDYTQLPGVRRFPALRLDACETLAWRPDSTALAITQCSQTTPPDPSTPSTPVDTSPPDPSVAAGTIYVDVMTVADGRLQRVIDDGYAATWSPDGTRLVYLRNRAGSRGAEVWTANPDGSDARPVTTSLIVPVWSPDSSLLVAMDDDDGLFTIQPDGTNKTPLTPQMQTETLADINLYHNVGFSLDWQPLPPDPDAEPTNDE